MKKQNTNDILTNGLLFEEVAVEELNGIGSYALGVGVGAGGTALAAYGVYAAAVALA